MPYSPLTVLLVNQEIEPTPKIETLQDAFTGVVLDTDKWEDTSDEPAIINNQLELESDASASVESVEAYDLTDSYVLWELVSVDTFTNDYFIDTYFATPVGDFVGWYLEAGDIFALDNGGVVFSGAYNSTDHRWLRIREDSGTTYWESSADGTNWTERASEPTSVDLTYGQFAFTSGSGVSKTTVFDNFNVEPAAGGTTPLRTLMGVGA